MKKKIFIIIGILVFSISCFIFLIKCKFASKDYNDIEQLKLSKENIIFEENTVDDNKIIFQGEEIPVEEKEEKNEQENAETQNESKPEEKTIITDSIEKSVKSTTDYSNKSMEKNTEIKAEIPKVSNEKSNSETTSKSENIEKENEVNKQTSKKIDLSKYDYYRNGLSGSYIGFKEDAGEINKLKSLIDEALAEFGYKNSKIVLDKSLSTDGSMYFTANKTNVRNAVYNSEGFTIYYYAINEYYISPEGKESYFQTRSYVEVK